MILGNKANTFKAIGLFLLLVILLFAQSAEAQVTYACNAQGNMVISECDALVEIYTSTDGTNWTDDTGWLAFADPCTWYGVTCSGSPPANVSSLVLGNNNLTGALPSDIEDLSDLATLNLQTNNLTNPLPSQLANLSSLTTLNLGGNQFTGNFPTEILSLGNLVTLNIAVNGFTGNLPGGIGGLSSLETLNIANNTFSGEIPTSFINLTNLIYFETTDNDDLCLPVELNDWYIGIEDTKGSLENCIIPTNTPIPNTLTPTPIPLPTLTPTITTTPTITPTPTLVGPLQTLTALAYEDTLTATANFLKTPSPEPTATKYYILVSQTLVLGGEDQQAPQDAGDQGDDIPIPDEDGGGGLSGLWWLLLIIPIGLIGAGVFLELRGRKAKDKEEESFSISEEEDDDGLQSFLDDL